jgi:hypothetical protein
LADTAGNSNPNVNQTDTDTFADAENTTLNILVSQADDFDMDTSTHSRRKQKICDVGDLSQCLCGVNFFTAERMQMSFNVKGKDVRWNGPGE